MSEVTVIKIENRNGPTLAYAKESGITILHEEGLSFKDFNKDGRLDKYEDWRLPPEERAKDLASKMTIEQIAGLMLYSKHQAVPASLWGDPTAVNTYDGKPFKGSGAEPWDLTDQQIKFLRDDNLRHILVTKVESPEVAAKWNNRVQAFAESIGLGIPVVLGCTALSLLELFVAFLQAYIFTFLTTLFLASAVAPEH